VYLNEQNAERIGSRMYGSFSLRKSYLLLIALAIIFSGLSLWSIYKNEWFSAYLSNIASGIIGSLIIIFLIDQIIARNRENERLRVVRIALKRLRLPILWHMTLLCKIYKASAQTKPTPLPTTFEDTFKDNYYREIAFLDFTKKAPVVPEIDWFNYLYLEMKSFKEKIEQVVDAYASFLDVTLIDMLEKIANSSFLLIIPQFRMVREVDRKEGFKRVYTMLSGMEKIVKEHVSLMLALIKYFNSKSDSPIQFNYGVWRDDEAPQWGSGRILSQSL